MTHSFEGSGEEGRWFDDVLGVEPSVERVSGRISIIRGFLESGITYVSSARVSHGYSIAEHLRYLEIESGIETGLFCTAEGAIEAGTGAALAGMSAAVLLKGSQLLSSLGSIKRLPMISVPGGLVLVAVEEPGIDVWQAAVSSCFPAIQEIDTGSLVRMVCSAFNISRSLRTPFLIRIPAKKWMDVEETEFGRLPDGKHFSEPVFPDSGEYSFISTPRAKAVERALKINKMLDNTDIPADYCDISVQDDDGEYQGEVEEDFSEQDISAVADIIEAHYGQYTMVHTESANLAPGLLKHREDFVASSHPLAMASGLFTAGISPLTVVLSADNLFSDQAGDILRATVKDMNVLVVVMVPDKQRSFCASANILKLFSTVRQRAVFKTTDKGILHWIEGVRSNPEFSLLVLEGTWKD